jgi:hypothetical protein
MPIFEAVRVAVADKVGWVDVGDLPIRLTSEMKP